MDDFAEKQREAEAYLARIRRTIAESSALVEQAELRIRETDRMLERQGLTREQVLGMRFTGEQRDAVNRELERLGLGSLEDSKFGSFEDSRFGGLEDSGAEGPGGSEPDDPANAQTAQLPDFQTSALSERQRGFSRMMKPFRI